MNKTALFFAAAAALCLLLLFRLMKPQEIAAPAPAAVLASSAPVAAAAIPQVFELQVRGGKLVSGPQLISVTQGEAVVLKITSDQADELHLHGYDLHAHLAANETLTLSFKAEHSGHFDYELHKAHAELGALEVLPPP